jgi:hypothetical protein
MNRRLHRPSADAGQRLILSNHRTESGETGGTHEAPAATERIDDDTDIAVAARHAVGER